MGILFMTQIATPSDLLILGYLNAAFLAVKLGNVSAVTDPIVFNLTPVNYGGYYDRTTGIDTVPMDGLYEFKVQIYCSLNGNVCVYYIIVDGTKMTDTAYTPAGTVIEDLGLSTSVILELAEGQQFWISPDNFSYDVAGSLGRMASWFAGQLLMAY